MNNKKIFNNFFWKLLEKVGSQGVTFIVSIVLARILDPGVYGTLALVTVFITILQVFVDSGLGNALIQKKDANDIDFSTVFYFNIFMCTVLYAIIFFLAPPIAKFYKMPNLTSIIRVSGLTLILSGIKNIQNAYVAKNMLFKCFFYSTLGATIGSAIVGIALAMLGFGVWALVWQNLFNTLVGTVILWFTVKWRPKKFFEFSRLKGLFSYGWKLLVSSLIDTIYNDIRQLIIGKLYSSNDLAFYNRGKQLPYFVAVNISTSIDSVLFPVMSSEQDNKQRIKAMTRRAIKTSSYIMMPLMIGMAVCAEPLVVLLLTEKWLPCVLFLRIFCVTYAFYPINAANLNAIKAVGRSDLFLKLEIVKKIVGTIALFSTIFISVEAMGYSLLLTSLTSQIINSWPNKKLLNYSYLEQIKDIFPQIGLTCFMALCVFLISYLGLSSILTLTLQIITGIIIYLIGSFVFKLESFEYLLRVLQQFFKKRKCEEKND